MQPQADDLVVVPLQFDAVVDADGWPINMTDPGFALRIAHAMTAVLEFERYEIAAICFADDARVARLNEQFRGNAKATNVLSFPAASAMPEIAAQPDDTTSASMFLGDIILARETIFREAEEALMPIEHHVAHLIVHGVLHLLGYNHENAAEAEEMEALEIDILAVLQIANPYTEELVDAR